MTARLPLFPLSPMPSTRLSPLWLFLASVLASALASTAIAPSVVKAQITIGPYSFPDATAFADTAVQTAGSSSFTGGATSLTAAVTGYSPSTAAVNVGYPCGTVDLIRLGFTDVRPTNGPGFDVVVFDARYSADVYEIAVRPVGGAFSSYRTYDTASQVPTGVTGPASTMLWGIEVDFADFGLAAAVVVDAIMLKGDCATTPSAEFDLVMAAVYNEGGCVSAADCDDGDDCTIDACVSNMCGNDPEPPGTLCSGGVCDGATTPSCVECVDAAHCDDSDECTDDACVMNVCAYPATAPGTVCTGGVCNGSDAMPLCVACLVDADCSGSTPRCDTATNTCVPCLDDADCDDDNECTDSSCDAGACLHAALPAGTECATGVCNGDDVMPLCASCFEDGDCSELLPLCAAGRCVECATDTDCDDANACTDDACDEGDGLCYYQPTPGCTVDGGGPPIDASPPVDTGVLPGRRDRGGCGCVISPPEHTDVTPTALITLFAFGLLAQRRRR